MGQTRSPDGPVEPVMEIASNLLASDGVIQNGRRCAPRQGDSSDCQNDRPQPLARRVLRDYRAFLALFVHGILMHGILHRILEKQMKM